MITLTIIFALVLIPVESADDQVSYSPVALDFGNWKLVKRAGGVETFVRWIMNSEGTSVRERKGEMTVNCFVQDAVRLLTDAGSTHKWMSGISENYCITRIDQSEWCTYTLFSIPWPFSKRDMVCWYKMNSDPSGGSVVIAIVSKDKYVPLKSGITRLADYKATWVITPVGEKNIKIVFSATSSAPLLLPRPIQDPVIERIFHNNLVRLKDSLSA
jgi:hypothetical protein